MDWKGVNMVFQFADKSMTIKHLCFILEVKKINTQTLKVKESIIKNSIAEDLLFYESEKALKTDLKKIYNRLDEYSRYVNDMQRQSQIGFSAEQEGVEELPEE
jgi:hypothetical protein